MNRVLAPVSRNLAGSFAFLFLVKDFLAIWFLATHKFGGENELIGRIALLPGSALLWGFAGHGAPIFNILFGALVGWLISLRYPSIK
jgi:hypothetical protein